MSTRTHTPTPYHPPPSRAQLVFAADFVEILIRTFFFAYYSHLNGVSESELLIDFDIEAAYTCTDKQVAESQRTTIKAAVIAVDARVPFCVAQHHLRSQLTRHIDSLLHHAVD